MPKYLSGEYVILFNILQSIDWDSYDYPLEAWQLRYYYQRERFLTRTKFSYDEFLSHTPLQNAINELGLEAEPTFEFILFLKYYFDLRSELRHSSIEQLNQARQALESMPADKHASIDINVGGKHFKIENTEFIKKSFIQSLQSNIVMEISPTNSTKGLNVIKSEHWITI